VIEPIGSAEEGTMPGKRPAGQRKRSSADANPEERARAAVEKEEALPGDKVRLTLRIVLTRRDAEALSARAIREERNVESVVEDLLAASVRGRAKS
jgi:hypothetical protein